MITKTMTSAAIVLTLLFTSCGQKGVTEAKSPSIEESVTISIWGTEVYSENYLNPPQEMDEIMSKLIDSLVENDERAINIELSYSMENADEVLIDAYMEIYYDNYYPKNTPSYGVTNKPNDDRVESIPLPPQRMIHADVIQAHCQRTFNDWWRRKKIAEQAGAGQHATRSVPDSEGGDKPQPESEGRSR